MGEPGGLPSMGSHRVGHNRSTYWGKGEKGRDRISLGFVRNHGHHDWRRQWQPTRVLAWRIAGTGEPGGLPSTGSHKIRHD